VLIPTRPVSFEGSYDKKGEEGLLEAAVGEHRPEALGDQAARLFARVTARPAPGVGEGDLAVADPLADVGRVRRDLFWRPARAGG
jgi:hypothetical protein